MTKPRSVAATANDNSIPGSRIEDGTITQEKLSSSVSFPPAEGSVNDSSVANDAAISSEKLEFSNPSSSSQPRTVESKLSDALSVKDFGAQGDWDGSAGTDDTAAIISAIAAAPPGGRVYFPPGRYLITDTLLLGKQINLEGDGWDSSRIFFDAENKACIQWSVNPFGSKISGLYIGSVKGKNSTTNEIGIKGRENGSNRQLVIDRCFITGFSLFGVMLHLGWNCLITNSEIRSCGNTTNQSGGIVVYNAGGGSTGSTGHVFQNNYIAGCYNGICAGAAVPGYAGRAWNNTYINNIYESNTHPVNFSGGGGRQTHIKHYQEANANPSIFNGGTIIDFISITSGTQTFPIGSVVLDKDKAILHGAFQTDDVDFAIKPSSRTGAQIGDGPSGTPIVRGKDGKFVLGSYGYEWDGQMMSVANGQDFGGDRDTIPGFAAIAVLSSAGADFLVGQYVSVSRDISGAGMGVKGAFKTYLTSNSGDSYVTIHTSNTTSNDIEQLRIESQGHVRPARDDEQTLGSASHRWSEVFAANNVINTSDARVKQDVEDLSDAEERVALAVKSLLKKFRYKDSVEKKGDEARVHVGIIAQDLQAAFEMEGLDAHKYGMFCEDFWYEYDGRVVSVNGNEKYVEESMWLDEQEIGPDEDGNYPEEAVKKIIEYDTIKKSQLGVRYDQLLAFVLAAL
jgi:hypothetical protein